MTMLTFSSFIIIFHEYFIQRCRRCVFCLDYAANISARSDSYESERAECCAFYFFDTTDTTLLDPLGEHGVEAFFQVAHGLAVGVPVGAFQGLL